ncbi:IclR family transcriptional regulator [Kribbella sp. NPDC004875]|uniref:IclR family transcriptional regulator n=1 Tax=Kribbella sp. NPDC004875 TaxID=3364107 RepID=UPI00368C0B38
MRSLERAIDVLEVLEDAPRGLRLSELARRANLHVATTLRILTTLEARGRVEHDGTHYRAGARLLFGAHAYLTTSPLALAARSVLQDLSSETGLTSSVFVRTGAHRAIIARVEGSDPLRYALPVGERLPLHLGAGKMLIAHLPEDELEPLIAEVTPFVTASGVEVTAAALRRELRGIAASGFAVSRDDRILGGRSVSAPVRGADDEVLAAIQVAGNEETFPTRRTKALTIAVRNAADALSRRL